jgi:hypothetical protein
MINKGRFRLFADSPAECSGQAIDLSGRATVVGMLTTIAISLSRSSL